MTEKKGVLKEVLSFLKSFAIALLVVILLKIFVIDVTQVHGISMLDTLHEGDLFLVNKIEKQIGDFDKGDIIILEAPDNPGRVYIKRVIATEGDEVSLKDGKVYLNGKELDEDYISTDTTLQTSDKDSWTIGKDEYFVMGDNRLPKASNDSRNYGPVKKSAIIGHAFFRFYPFDDMGLVDKE